MAQIDQKSDYKLKRIDPINDQIIKIIWIKSIRINFDSDFLRDD
jgi:hypothetical protein